jgi:hypothetical protein
MQGVVTSDAPRTRKWKDQAERALTERLTLDKLAHREDAP